MKALQVDHKTNWISRIMRDILAIDISDEDKISALKEITMALRDDDYAKRIEFFRRPENKYGYLGYLLLSSGTVRGLFVWEKSTQGHSFWSRIDRLIAYKKVES